MSENKAWLLALVMALVTAALRVLPFLIFKDQSKTPKIIHKLSSLLPYAIMGMLVVYCLKDISFVSIDNYLPTVISALLIVVLHVWKRNTLLSIVAGTACYIVCVQFIF